MGKGIRVAAGLGMVLLLAAQAPDPVRRWEGNGLKLELEPLLPDQVSAFFIGRGFPAEAAGLVAREGCLFRVALGNSSGAAGAPAVDIRLKDWGAVTREGRKPLRVREDWEPLWDKLNLDTESRVAFRWALFPTEQTFGAADFNWGYLAFGLPVGTPFAADLAWRTGGKAYTRRIEGLECGKR